MAWPTMNVAKNKIGELKSDIKVLAEAKGKSALGQESKTDDTRKTNKIKRVRVKRILVGDGRRACDAEQVKMIADSMVKIGLINPITVAIKQPRTDDEEDPASVAYQLIAGLHRLEAAKLLKWKRIEAIVVVGNPTENRLREIAENLFRNELTQAERAELVAEWAKLSGQKDAHVVQPGGRQPNDKGNNKAAKALKLSREDVRRSKAIAGMSAKAKKAAKEAGLDDNQKALLEIAKEPTPNLQMKKVGEIKERKKKGRHKMGFRSVMTRKKTSSKSGSPPTLADECLAVLTPLDAAKPNAYFTGIESVWVKSGLGAAWAKAPTEVRKRFIAEVLK